MPGVTLLGDAAHLMPPSGEGANLTMFDGSELGTALATHPDDIEAAITACEQAMFARSAAEAADAHEILDLCLGDRAPFGLNASATQPGNLHDVSEGNKKRGEG